MPSEPAGSLTAMKDMITAGAIGTAIGIVLAVIVQLIARAADVDFVVEGFGGEIEEVGLAQTIPAVVFGGMVLTAIALLLGRFGPAGLRLFLGVATVLLVLSFISPFRAAETSETAVSLSLMHIAAAMGIVGALARQLKEGLRLSA